MVWVDVFRFLDNIGLEIFVDCCYLRGFRLFRGSMWIYVDMVGCKFLVVVVRVRMRVEMVCVGVGFLFVMWNGVV